MQTKLLYITLIWSVFPAQGAQLPLTFLDEVCDGSFSFRCEMKGNSEAWETGEGLVAFNWQEDGKGYLLSIRRGSAQLVKVQDGRKEPLMRRRRISGWTGEAPLSLTVKRRGERISIIAAGETLLTARDKTFTSGKVGTGSVGTALEFTDVRYQPVEPLHFRDDFMRAAQEQSPWTSISGQWKTVGPQGPTKRLANPFTYQAECGAGANAVALAGHWFWDEYALEASVRPETAKAIGLVLYAQDEKNHLLFRWTAGAVTGTRQWVRVRDGTETVLAEADGGFEPSQWYRLRAQVEGNRLRASIDGVPVLEAKGAGFGQGKMGLYLSTGDGSATAQFDDVTVESVNTVREDRLVAERVPNAFAVDPIMRRWATEEDWWEGNAEKGYWHRGVFFKDPLLQLPLPAPLPSDVKLVATICASDEDPGSGYTLEIGNQSAPSWRLLRLGRPVVEIRKELSSECKSLVLRQQGRKVVAQAGEEELLSFSDPQPLRGERVGFKTAGFAVEKSRATALSPHMDDCAFAEAPVDWWVERGTWESMQRWGCWGQSHFGAYDPVAAITWTKKSYSGDIVVECYCSNAPMGDFSTAVHDLNITLCGDGANLVSGYSFIFAGVSGNTQILRHNKVVAQKPFTGAKQNISQDWFCLRIEKRGGKLQMFVDHQPVLEFTDPQPLRGGKVAMWTVTGSLVLARVRIWFERCAKMEPIPNPVLRLASNGCPSLTAGSSDRSSGLPDLPVTFNFEQDGGTLSTRDSVDAAILSFDDQTASKGKRSLRVTNRVCGGHFALWVTKESFDAKQHPVVSFDYRVPSDVRVNLYAKVKGAWHEITFTAAEPEKKDRVLGVIKGIVADNRWRHAEFNLLEAVQSRFGSENLPRVEGLSIASPNERGLRLGFEGNPFGASYHLDEVRL